MTRFQGRDTNKASSLATTDRNQQPPHDQREPESDLIPISRAANFLPGRPNASTIWRWCRNGIRARSGTVIRLEHRRLGGKIFTSRRWLDEFGARLTAADVQYFEDRNDEGATETSDPRTLMAHAGLRGSEGHDDGLAGDLNADLKEEGL